MNKYIFELTVFEDDDKFWAKNPTVEDIEEVIWQALRTNNFWHDNSKLEFVEYEKENIATCTTHQMGTNRIDKYACDYLVNMDNLAEWSNENTNSVKFEIIINKDKNVISVDLEDDFYNFLRLSKFWNNKCELRMVEAEDFCNSWEVYYGKESDSFFPAQLTNNQILTSLNEIKDKINEKKLQTSIHSSWQCFNCKTIYAPYITKCECVNRSKGGTISQLNYIVGESEMNGNRDIIE